MQAPAPKRGSFTIGDLFRQPLMRRHDPAVAVGARGHILVSSDAGATWTQSPHVPTLALLTAVTMLDEQRAWVVGHDETIGFGMR